MKKCNISYLIELNEKVDALYEAKYVETDAFEIEVIKAEIRALDILRVEIAELIDAKNAIF